MGTGSACWGNWLEMASAVPRVMVQVADVVTIINHQRWRGSALWYQLDKREHFAECQQGWFHSHVPLSSFGCCKHWMMELEKCGWINTNGRVRKNSKGSTDKFLVFLLHPHTVPRSGGIIGISKIILYDWAIVCTRCSVLVWCDTSLPTCSLSSLLSLLPLFCFLEISTPNTM